MAEGNGSGKKKWNDFFLKLLSNKWFWIILAVIILMIFIYFEGKEDQVKKDEAKKASEVALPNSGSGIPAGWTAEPDATVLYVAMEHGDGGLLGWGYGTDEDAIWNTLTGKTDDQLAAISNAFNKMYETSTGMTLKQWFEDDLEGDDLVRALDYFNGIPGWK